LKESLPDSSNFEEDSVTPDYSFFKVGKPQLFALANFETLESACSLLFLDQPCGGLLISASKTGIVHIHVVDLEEITPTTDSLSSFLCMVF